MSPTPPVSLTDWVAGDLSDLRSIWESLRPDLDAADTQRTFRGQPLTPQQAGDVFERWVMEAFRLSGARGAGQQHHRSESSHGRGDSQRAAGS